MSLEYRMRQWAGLCCLALVALFCLLGYYFGNVRFAPIAAGFLILAAVAEIERGEDQAQSNAVESGADSGFN